MRCEEIESYIDLVESGWIERQAKGASEAHFVTAVPSTYRLRYLEGGTRTRSLAAQRLAKTYKGRAATERKALSYLRNRFDT